MTESTAQTTELINYIDNTSEENSARKFGTVKPWHIITKLSTALIIDIGNPREGNLNSSEAGNRVSISKVNFYSALQPMHVMRVIATLNYRNLSVVSTKLVKSFL